jgi:hypothetical protein
MREFDIPWVGDGFKISWVGFIMLEVKGSIYHERGSIFLSNIFLARNLRQGSRGFGFLWVDSQKSHEKGS